MKKNVIPAQAGINWIPAFAGMTLAVAVLFLALPAQAAPAPKKGLWITCLGKSNVLGSAAEINKAVSFAKQAGIGMIFVQVYRADKTWFDSNIAEDTPFQKNRAAMKTDPLAFMIERAHAQGIEVHTWINTLTLSQNKSAKLLRQSGNRVLTRDQYGRDAMDDPDKKDNLDKYYEREHQMFLEPGDMAVRRRVLGIVKEIATKYPALDGIHFDYIRYPAAPPYIPGSRFNNVGLSYGYGEENVKRFKAQSNLDPYKLSFDQSRIWDDWKRSQITGLLREAAGEARKIHPGIKISAAVLAAFDRAYLAAYQDWPTWTDEGIADFIVLMNYSKDSHYVSRMIRAAKGLVGDPSKVYVGIGAFLMSAEPQTTAQQVKESLAQKVGGVVLFDYDSITESAALKKVVLPE